MKHGPATTNGCAMMEVRFSECMHLTQDTHSMHTSEGRSREVGEGKEELVDSLEGKCATQRARVWAGVCISRFPGAGP